MTETRSTSAKVNLLKFVHSEEDLRVCDFEVDAFGWYYAT